MPCKNPQVFCPATVPSHLAQTKRRFHFALPNLVSSYFMTFGLVVDAFVRKDKKKKDIHTFHTHIPYSIWDQAQTWKVITQNHVAAGGLDTAGCLGWQGMSVQLLSSFLMSALLGNFSEVFLFTSFFFLYHSFYHCGLPLSSVSLLHCTSFLRPGMC